MVLSTFRARTALAVLLASCAAPVLAQDYPAAPYDGTRADPIDVLSAHLRTLASSPRNFGALVGAGDAALAIGDPNAALGFFARAEQIDPRSGKAKAGLASALVALEKPSDALPLFAQALTLGVSEAEIAKDRGLAYDLRGDTRLAQRDYALALKRAPDDETVRRYALSLGISGQRSEAMSLLEPLLRRKDQSAWRARAFILAMNGDVSGANGITRQVMPANLAAAMTPFLTRLATLNPADRAHAVNFGTMPSSGGVQMASVQIGDPFKPVGGGAAPAVASSPPSRGFTTPGVGQGTGTGLIPAGEPLGAKSVRVAERVASLPPASSAPVRAVSPAPSFPAPAAPGFSVGPDSPPPPLVTERVARIGPVDPAKLPPEARGPVAPAAVVSTATTLPLPLPTVRAAPVPAPAFETPPTSTLPAPVAARVVAELPPPVKTEAPAAPPLPRAAEPSAIVTAALPPSVVAEKPLPAAVAPAATGLVGPPASEVSTVVTTSLSPSTATEATAAPAPVLAPVAVAPVVAPPASRLSSILEGVTPENEAAAVALPSAAEIRAQRRLAAKKAEAAAAAAAEAEAAKEEKAALAAAAKANPARLWVQVATGANTRGLSGTWARIRDGNAAALKGKAAYSVPFRSTNRLIVGPVKSASEARALVGALAKGGVQATTYNSEAGQEVTRVSAK